MQLVKFKINNSEISGNKLVMYFNDNDIKIFVKNTAYGLVNLTENKIIYDLETCTFENGNQFIHFKSEFGDYSPMEIKYLLLMMDSIKINPVIQKELNKHSLGFKSVYSHDIEFNLDTLMNELHQYNVSNLTKLYVKTNDQENLQKLFESIY